MPSHIVKAFDAELNQIKRKLIEMGGISERMISDAMQALEKRDQALAQRVVATDPKLDALQREIEEEAILLIARRQPLAGDLRATIAAIRIAGDLERVGDLAKNIGKRVVAIQALSLMPKVMSGLVHMSEIAQHQIKMVLDSYTNNDLPEADAVWQRDGEIDALYTSLFRELLTYMMEDPRHIGACTHLLFTAKNIERIGDHATNIAETVHYIITGSNLPVERPKGEDGRLGKTAPADT